MGYNHYKHQILNCPFGSVSFNYIISCLNQLTIDINCSFTKAVFKECTPTEEQSEIIHIFGI